MKREIKGFFSGLNSGGVSLRWRFMLYVISAVVASVMLLLLLLSIFGVLDTADGRILSYLDDQLNNHIKQTEHDIDRIAACSISFASEMENIIDGYLSDGGISFTELSDNADALTGLQSKCFSTVYTNLRIAPCSGAFYILDTTVNNSSEVPYYNGIYIKYANLYAENTANTGISLFRGSYEVARGNNVNLYSTWQNEMRTDIFENLSVFDGKDYVISAVEALPDTWERARYVYSPIHSRNGDIIGICGLEINDLYLKLTYSAADTESKHAVCAILDSVNGGYKGQFISNRSGYLPPECEYVTAKEQDSFVEYVCGKSKYIGNKREIVIDGNKLTLAMMIPKSHYSKIVTKRRMMTASIFFIITLAAFGSSLWLSKKYIAPIRQSIVEFKENTSAKDVHSGIIDIDDFFSFLAEQDRKNEAALAEVQKQNIEIQSTLDQISEENTEARREIARLSYLRKDEVNQDDYEQFLSGLKTLTKMERSVFDYYLEGKKVKEIVEILGIKESTVRFHNRNIYSKLGVNSLKQLLLFAAIMKGNED